MGTKPPCKGCKIRHEGCWDKCIDYQVYKQKKVALNEFLRQNDADDVLIRGAVKTTERKKRK